MCFLCITNMGFHVEGVMFHEFILLNNMCMWYYCVALDVISQNVPKQPMQIVLRVTV